MFFCDILFILSRASQKFMPEIFDFETKATSVIPIVFRCSQLHNIQKLISGRNRLNFYGINYASDTLKPERDFFVRLLSIDLNKIVCISVNKNIFKIP